MVGGVGDGMDLQGHLLDAGVGRVEHREQEQGSAVVGREQLELKIAMLEQDRGADHACEPLG